MISLHPLVLFRTEILEAIMAINKAQIDVAFFTLHETGHLTISAMIFCVTGTGQQSNLS